MRNASKMLCVVAQTLCSSVCCGVSHAAWPKNKWTKLLPSFDFFILGQTPHKMLHQLSRAAMGPLVSEYTAGAGRQSDPERMAFHRIAGQRLQRVFSILDSDDVAFSHMLIEIVNEPGRELTMFFMEAAEGSVRSHGHPHLMDVALPEASGILASLEYLSGLYLEIQPQRASYGNDVATLPLAPGPRLRRCRR